MKVNKITISLLLEEKHVAYNFKTSDFAIFDKTIIFIFFYHINLKVEIYYRSYLIRRKEKIFFILTK